jgi:hypothetical protein
MAGRSKPTRATGLFAERTFLNEDILGVDRDCVLSCGNRALADGKVAWSSAIRPIKMSVD